MQGCCMPRRGPNAAQLKLAGGFLRKLLPCSRSHSKHLPVSSGIDNRPTASLSLLLNLHLDAAQPAQPALYPQRHPFPLYHHFLTHVDGSSQPTSQTGLWTSPPESHLIGRCHDRLRRPPSTVDWPPAVHILPSAARPRTAPPTMIPRSEAGRRPAPACLLVPLQTKQQQLRRLSNPSSPELLSLPRWAPPSSWLRSMQPPVFSTPQQQPRTERCYSTGRTTDFASLGITPELQERLSAQGLQAVLPVQAAAVPLILGGRNIAIKSCTGSGKTLAYLLPVIQLALERRRAAEASVAAAADSVKAGSDKDGAITTSSTTTPSNCNSGNSSNSNGSGSRARQRQTVAALKRLARSPQAVIVTPSRELCIQIQRTAQDLMPGPAANRRMVQQLIGGANPRRQEAALAGGDGGVWPLVVVGTPGRVADKVTHGSLHVWGCPLLVLDEVDQLYGQKELRQHVDTISAHVGRRSQQQHLHRKHSFAGAGATDKSADGSASPSNSKPPSGIGSPAEAAALSGGGGSGGRQTVIVSASLDARDPSRYVAWCHDPAFVVLGSMQALPPALLRTLQPSTSTEPKAEAEAPAGEPDGASDKVRGNAFHDGDGGGGGVNDYTGWPGSVRRDSVETGSRAHQKSSPRPSSPPDLEEPCRASEGVPAISCIVPNQQPRTPTDDEGRAQTITDGDGVSQRNLCSPANPAAALSPLGSAIPDCSSNSSDGSNSGGDGAAAAAASADQSVAGPLSGVLPPQLAHLYVLTHSKHRTDRVRRLIHALGAERALLFVPKQNQTMVTKYRLEARRMEVTVLHGRLSKLERGNIMEAFRRGVFRTLVVTELGARGLDLPDCDAVINFGPPADALSYAHRAGRTGRVGAAGIVVSVVTRLELPALRRIAKQLGLYLQGASVSHGTIAPGEEAESDEQAEPNPSVVPCYVGDS